jgi:hypothetical protein
VVPGILIAIGIWNIQGDYPLPHEVWWFSSGYALMFSIFLYASFLKFIRPYLPKGEALNTDDEKA